METLNCKRKERCGWRRRTGWWRGRVTDDKIDLIWLIWENKIERTASHSMESNSVVSKCVSLLISVPSYQWGLICFKIRILSTKSANHKICQPVTILCLTLPFHSSEIWVSRANWRLHWCFALESSTAASGRHFANAVFATAAPTVIPQGGGAITKCVYFCF